MGLLRRRKENNVEEHKNLWLCEKKLEGWFRDNPNRRLPQSFKRHLISKYNLYDSIVLLASRRVRRRLRT
jgi:hypothetical protein